MTLNEETKKTILNLWEQRVRNTVPSVHSQTSFALQDHLPEFIDKLLKALQNKFPSAGDQRVENISEQHGTERAIIEKYSLGQVLQEYSLLRLVVIEVLSENNPLTLEEQNIIHSFIDRAEMIAGISFEQTRTQIAERMTSEIRRHNRDLEQFASIAAHDLRSPIATIYSYASFLEEECHSPNEEVRQGFEFVKLSATRLIELIDRLLNYAKIGVTQVKIEKVDLRKVLEDVINSLGNMIRENHAKIIYKNLPTIDSDPMFLTQLFQNLISNGIKFRGPEDPLIEVTLEHESSTHWAFSVKDNGIGFEESQKEVIFQPFKRLHSEVRYYGTGLGLATARRTVEILGGQIWSESSPGKGAKFIFTIAKPVEVSLPTEVTHEGELL